MESVVLLSFKRVTAIPGEATASAIFTDYLTFSNIKLAMNVFSVPPRLSKKKNK